MHILLLLLTQLSSVLNNIILSYLTLVRLTVRNILHFFVFAVSVISCPQFPQMTLTAARRTDHLTDIHSRTRNNYKRVLLLKQIDSHVFTSHIFRNNVFLFLLTALLI